MLEDTSAGMCGLRVGVGCSEGRFGVDGTWRRSWEDGPVRMRPGAGGGLTWGHRLRPSQTGVRVAPASLPRATAAFPGPTRNPSRPERGAGAGAPAVPAEPGSCTRPGRGGFGWACSRRRQLCSSPALCASSPPPDRILARRWAGSWIRGPSPLRIIIAPGSGGGPLAEPAIPTVATLQDWTRPSVHPSSAPPAPGTTSHPA